MKTRLATHILLVSILFLPEKVLGDDVDLCVRKGKDGVVHIFSKGGRNRCPTSKKKRRKKKRRSKRRARSSKKQSVGLKSRTRKKRSPGPIFNKIEDLCVYEGKDGVVHITSSGTTVNGNTCGRSAPERKREAGTRASGLRGYSILERGYLDRRKTKSKYRLKRRRKAGGLFTPLSGRLKKPKLSTMYVSEDGVLTGPKASVLKIHSSLSDRLSARKRDPFRVVQFGDMHTKNGFFAEAMKESLFRTPPSPGFVTKESPTDWNATVSMSSRWRTRNRRARNASPFGPLGRAYETSESGQTVTLSLKNRGRKSSATKVTLYYYSSPNHRRFSVTWPGQKKPVVITPRQSGHNKHAFAPGEPIGATNLIAFKLPPRVNKLILKTKKESDTRSIRIYGFQVEYTEAELEWSLLARKDGLASAFSPTNDSSVEDFLALREPDLIIGWFGTNALMKKRFRQGAYDKDYRRFVKTVRSSSPASSCLLIGPPDLSTRPAGCFLSKKELRAKKGRSTRRKRAILKAKAMQRICRPDSLLNTQKRGRYRFPVPGVKNYKDWQSHKSRCAYRTHPSIRTLIATQKRIAHQAGCLYFDVYRYMGGAGSMHKWVCEYLPNLADLNHVNLTPVGYQRIGRAVVRDLDKAIIELVGIGLRGRKNAENAK